MEIQATGDKALGTGGWTSPSTSKNGLAEERNDGGDDGRDDGGDDRGDDGGMIRGKMGDDGGG